MEKGRNRKTNSRQKTDQKDNVTEHLKTMIKRSHMALKNVMNIYSPL